MRKALAEGKQVVRIDDERTLSNLEARAQELREQMKDFEQRYTPAYMKLNASVQAVKRNLEKTEEEILTKRAEAQQAALAEASRAFQGAQEQAAKLRVQYAEYKKTVAEFTARFAEHGALQEELTELEQLYRDVQQRLVKTEVSDEHQRPGLEILEQAFEPLRPIRPLYMRDAGICLAAAFFLGLLAIWLTEFFTRKSDQVAPTQDSPFLYRVLQRAQPAPLISAHEPAAALAHKPLRELSETEVRMLLEASAGNSQALIMFLLSGFRVEEAALLRWQDLSLTTAEAQIVGASQRRVSLPGAAR